VQLTDPENASRADRGRMESVNAVAMPLLIIARVVTEVGLWQWRMVVAARGRRGVAMLLGTVGAALQITVISQVATNLTDPVRVGAYAVGVGIGVWLGLVAGERLVPGVVGVTITTADPDVAARLWACGWAATVQAGYDASGPVAVVSVAVDRRQAARLHEDVARWDPGARCSTEELRSRTDARSGSSHRRPAAPRQLSRTAPPPSARSRIRGSDAVPAELVH
jgi:uncharacterized protein YebE (UPF0316 family)